MPVARCSLAEKGRGSKYLFIGVLTLFWPIYLTSLDFTLRPPQVCNLRYSSRSFQFAKILVLLLFNKSARFDIGITEVKRNGVHIRDRKNGALVYNITVFEQKKSGCR